MKLERCEGAVFERQSLGAAFAQLDLVAETGQGDPLPRAREHLGTLIEPDDMRPRAPGYLDRNGGRARRHVEHRVAGAGFDARHEETAPTRILPE